MRRKLFPQDCCDSVAEPGYPAQILRGVALSVHMGGERGEYGVLYVCEGALSLDLIEMA